MRHGQKFSERPKRTHEERRLARIPLQLFGTIGGSPISARVLAIQWGAWDGICFHRRSGSITSWMKRAHYLKGFTSTVRRGKWAARAKRGKEKRRWQTVRIGGIECRRLKRLIHTALPCGKN
jgi:hypothetical protein